MSATHRSPARRYTRHGHWHLDALGDDQPRKTSRHLLLVLGLPTLGLAFAISVLTSYGPVVLIRFTDSPSQVGLLIGAEGAFALLVPLASGAFSDRLSGSALGRRLPFVLTGTPLAVAGLVFLPFADSMTLAALAVLAFFVGYYLYYPPYRGPGVSEELIAEALFPYDGLLIATKGGYERTGRSGRSAKGELIGWTPNGRPGHLRAACEASLSRLRLDRIDLYQLHTPDPAVPFTESIGALDDLQREGKIRHIGVSNVTLEQLAVARTVTAISTVQNHLYLTNRHWHDVLTECESHEIGIIP